MPGRLPINVIIKKMSSRTAMATSMLFLFLPYAIAQQQPDKRNPAADADAVAASRASVAEVSGYSDGTPAAGASNGCICPENYRKKRLFRRKCRVHPKVDLSSLPNPFEEIPLGLQLNETMSTQVRNYENTRQIFYHYDFIDNSAELNHAGKNKLARISQNAFSNFAPIVVESTPRQPGVDHARRLHLVQTIANNGIPIPAERVIVAGAVNRGLSGPDSMILYNRSLNDLQQSPGSSGISSQSGSGVGGLSGSGLLPNTQQSGASSSGN